MNVSLKHQRCVKCYNTKNNEVSFMTNLPYRGLYKIVCASCNNKWLVCTLHDLRWGPRRYNIAEQHVKTFHDDNMTSPLNCNVNNLTTNDETDNIEENDDNESFDVTNSNVDNYNSVDTSSVESIVNNFIDSHRPVSLIDYNQ